MKELVKFVFRFLKHLLVFVCILFPLQVLGALVLLLYLPINRISVVAKLVKKLSPNIRLPYILRWFDNADIYPDIKRDSSTYVGIWSQGWWAQYCWLAWRNPLNYFGYKILGLDINTGVTVDQKIYTGQDSLNVGDATGQKSGLFYTEVGVDDKIYYEYYYIYVYTLPTKSTPLCVRFRMGHKLGEITDPKFCQYVSVISPFHSFRGLV